MSPAADRIAADRPPARRSLLVTHVDLCFGGVERQLCYLLDALADSHAWDTDLLLFGADGEMARLVPEGIRISAVGQGRTRGLRMAREVARVGSRYSAVLAFHGYTHWVTAAGLIAGRSKTPLVISAPGASVPGRLDPMRRLLAPRIDAVHAVTSDIATTLQRKYDLSCPLVVIPNAVDTDAVRSASGAASAAHALRASGHDPVVCTVGRLVPVKRVDTIIEAVERMRAHVPAGLVVVGDGPERGRLEALTSALGVRDSVRFVGFTDKPYDELAGSDLFALASESEGLPSVILEAMVAGLPVASTRYIGGYDEILRDEETALLVDVGDPAAMATALLRLHTDRELARRLVGESEDLVASYDTRAYGRAFLRLLHDAAGSSENGDGDASLRP